MITSDILSKKIYLNLNLVLNIMKRKRKIRNNGRLFQITLPYACFGVEIKEGVVTDCAPIWGWDNKRTLK